MLQRRHGAIVLACLLAGCAGQRAYQEGNALLAQDQVAAGLAKYQEAVAADPGNAQYRSALLVARDKAATRLVLQAENAMAAGHGAEASAAWSRVLAFDPANERARAGLRLVEADRRHAAMLDDARQFFERKEHDAARQKLGAILTERPNHEAARLLLLQVDEAAAKTPTGEAALATSFRKPISLEFRDAPLKQIFEIISRHSGLNFIFDKDVKADARSSIFLKNSTVEAAIYYLLMSNQLERQVMDGNTILVYPNVPAKLREYQEMTVKTFFLANADAKNIANTFKTILKSRDVVVDEKLNLVILRDSPEAIKVATQLVALQDVPESEVMLEVEVLEVKRSSVMDLGISWPAALSFSPLAGPNGAPVTINELRGLNRDNILVGGVTGSINANKADGDTNTLANPRIRVRNKEKAKVVIGEKIPTFSTTVSSGIGGFATQTPTYVDVGLTLNVEPTIYLNNEVGIRIALEVSTLGELVTSGAGDSGSSAYRIGTRSATTMLQLKDGENQVLAGLISNEDRSSGSKVPGFGDIPVVGRLFGSTRDQTDRTEIVLSITPHLVRTVQRPAASASEFGAGTEANFRRRPDTTARAPVQLPITGAGTPRPVLNAAPATPPATERPFSVPPSQLPQLPAAPQATEPPAVQVEPVPAPPPATTVQ